MLNFKGTFAGALLVGMSVLSSAAMATPVQTVKAKITGYEYNSPVKVNVDLDNGHGWWNSSAGTVKAGAYEGQWLDGTSFAAFCVEITQGLAPLNKFTSYTEGTFSSSVASNLTNLANKYYSFVDDAISSAAFQVAVWEIVTETKKGLDLDKGHFEASPTQEWKGIWFFGHYVDNADSKAAIDLAKTWLAGVNDSKVAATGDYSLTYLKNKSYQDLVVFTPIAAVPEPATYGMLILGMGLIALFARRRRADTIRF